MKESLHMKVEKANKIKGIKTVEKGKHCTLIAGKVTKMIVMFAVGFVC